MGCDGGTIPKRKEVVKNKTKTTRRERKKGMDEAERWKTCALSDWPLRKPIVASPYGYLMSKEEILMHIVEMKRDMLSSYHRRGDKPEVLSPIHSTKDIVELKLKENPNKDDADASTSTGGPSDVADFVCPITGLETNGKYKFMFSWLCGCVVSERAIKEVPNNDKCLVCQTPYKAWELVLINPSNHKELTDNKAKFLARKMAPILAKTDSELEESSCSNQESPSSSQRPSTSKSATSKDAPQKSNSRTAKRTRDHSSSSNRESPLSNQQPSTSKSATSEDAPQKSNSKTAKRTRDESTSEQSRQNKRH